MTRIMKISKSTIDKCIFETVKVLKNGGLVVFPTDTVYGLLVDAKNQVAVKKLLKFKDRPVGKPISVFIDSINNLKEYVELNNKNKQILQRILPGPFTVVFRSKHTLDLALESEKGTLGIRLPQSDYIQKLMDIFQSPLTATSANMSGQSPHYSIESLKNQVSSTKEMLIDLIIDAGKLPHNKPSTVVELISSNIKTLRTGDLPFVDSKNFYSKSPSETRKIGQMIIEELTTMPTNKAIVIILIGDLGVGKTEITRGIAKQFGITKIISPTYVIYYEYDISHRSSEISQKRKFIHADLYNIEEDYEYNQLGLTTYIKNKSIMVIEWGEKLGDYYNKFKKDVKIIQIRMEYDGKNGRKITVIK
ncbi:hypothetical protein COY14_05100 [Candidatus Roizmanbacteria bacterium CG_4_10_14_0_2_um_filter_36_9]|uniref:L-threonylcarbamoyladenylate synthase n=2 Tax=Candidatus Roizmaniibacteriota TaxID=1752723 RepID=A0A2M7U266_9BACT|nr:MAG: hypothetical protein COY14_05100 [Candidatus Roizmanbacteria bacterium CG_4_10_14_0_2_um_filter_36_9]